MKTTTFSCPLLLVAVLVVPLVVAAPLEAAPDDGDLNEALNEFLELNPSIAKNLYPRLVNAANYVTLTINEDIALDLVENYVKDVTTRAIVEQLEDEEKEEEAETEEKQEERTRQKRETSFSGGINSASNPFGRSLGGSATLNHAWDDGRHSLSSTFGAQRETLNGMGSFNSYNAGVGYKFSPNDRTSLGIDAHKKWTPAGDSHGIKLIFKHMFRR